MGLGNSRLNYSNIGTVSSRKNHREHKVGDNIELSKIAIKSIWELNMEKNAETHFQKKIEKKPVMTAAEASDRTKNNPCCTSRSGHPKPAVRMEENRE